MLSLLTLVATLFLVSVSNAQCSVECPDAQECHDTTTDGSHYRNCRWSTGGSEFMFNLPAIASNVIFNVTGGSGGGAIPNIDEPASGVGVGASILLGYHSNNTAQTFLVYPGANGAGSPSILGTAGLNYLGGTLNGVLPLDGQSFGGGAASALYVGSTRACIAPGGDALGTTNYPSIETSISGAQAVLSNPGSIERSEKGASLGVDGGYSASGASGGGYMPRNSETGHNTGLIASALYESDLFEILAHFPDPTGMGHVSVQYELPLTAADLSIRKPQPRRRELRRSRVYRESKLMRF